MKSKYLILSVLGLAASASLTGCYEMDTVQLNQYLSDDQKSEAKEANPELAQSSITGITGVFSTYNTNFSEETHSDFGFPSIMLDRDSRAVDMVGIVTGYNWFSAEAQMNDATPTADGTIMIWNNCYKQIRSANSALAGLPAETEDPTRQFYIAQAKAIRAYDYMVLAQTYQFTYVGNEDKPCVMLITEENEADYAANGSTRATVEAIYGQIMKDLNDAVALLEESGVQPSDVLESKPKRFVSLATAYGLRARANLIMNNWEDAANDAAKAIANFNGAPMSMETASHPGLSSIDEPNWMWGIAIAPTDRVVTSRIVNWPSHMGSLNYGYASVGAWRMINTKLYNNISDTDVRKNWFLNAAGISAGLDASQQAYCQQAGMPAYTQVKFAPYQGVLYQDNNANDIMLMRVEEMYLIQAEATAMAGGDGASILTNFVKTYRDPAYSFTGAGEAVQEECFMQRRIELWGEGLTTFDFMRLKKPFDRRGGGWAPEVTYNVAANDPVLIVPIPESEVNGNKLFTAADNNPSTPQPTPVQ